jgi:hypothetical protein
VLRCKCLPRLGKRERKMEVKTQRRALWQRLPGLARSDDKFCRFRFTIYFEPAGTLGFNHITKRCFSYMEGVGYWFHNGHIQKKEHEVGTNKAGCFTQQGWTSDNWWQHGH